MQFTMLKTHIVYYDKDFMCDYEQLVWRWSSRLPNQVCISFNKLNGTPCGTHAPNMSLNIC